MPREGALETQNQSVSQRNQCIGVSRGGRSTKIHAVVDGLGNPVHVLLSTGNTSDITVAEDLLNQVSINGSTVLADKAYGVSLALFILPVFAFCWLNTGIMHLETHSRSHLYSFRMRHQRYS